MGDALRRCQKEESGNQRDIRLFEASAVPGLYHYHMWLVYWMADDTHDGAIPNIDF